MTMVAAAVCCLFATTAAEPTPAQDERVLRGTALAEGLLQLALAEKAQQDPYLYWLFATAAAEVAPSTQKIVSHAVEAWERLDLSSPSWSQRFCGASWGWVRPMP